MPIKHYTFLEQAARRANMPLVTIKILEGRTKKQKQGMAKDVTDAIAKNIGCPPAAVNIDIVEMKEENYAVGGTLWCDNH
jgi:4-oxalocrotonate tautomerase